MPKWAEIPKVPWGEKTGAFQNLSAWSFKKQTVLCVFWLVSHHPFQLGTVGRLSDDVILRGCDAQEVQVLVARGAARGFRRLIAVQHPDIILTQQGVFYRNKYTQETKGPLEVDVKWGNNEQTHQTWSCVKPPNHVALIHTCVQV